MGTSHKQPQATASVTTRKQSLGGTAAPLSESLAEIAARIESTPVRAQPEVDSEERARIAERRERWLSFVAVRGRRYSECRLETYEAASQKQKDAVCKLHEYASDIEQRIKDGQNVLLFGPAGTGKDHLLVALSRVAYRAGYTVAWANGQDLFSALRDAMDEGTTEKRTLRDFTNGDIQYISDPLPPVGDAGKWQQETLFRIIDRCYSNLRPVWVTLNVKDKQEAQQRLGVQTTDRLMHGALIIPCNWESYRKPF